MRLITLILLTSVVAFVTDARMPILRGRDWLAAARNAAAAKTRTASKAPVAAVQPAIVKADIEEEPKPTDVPAPKPEELIPDEIEEDIQNEEEKAGMPDLSAIKSSFINGMFNKIKEVKAVEAVEAVQDNVCRIELWCIFHHDKEIKIFSMESLIDSDKRKGLEAHKKTMDEFKETSSVEGTKNRIVVITPSEGPKLPEELKEFLGSIDKSTSKIMFASEEQRPFGKDKEAQFDELAEQAGSTHATIEKDSFAKFVQC